MNKRRLFIILVLVLAFFLRTYKLDNLELFGDELDVGYQASSLLKTGRDYRGNFLPVYLESLSESRAPLFLYSAIPSVALFGLNEWGVRLPTAIWGTLSILLLYLVVKQLFTSEKIALWASFLLTVAPWHIHYSRAGFEVTLLLFLILLATYFFLNKKLIFSFLLFGLSFYVYNTANVFVPIFLFFLIYLSSDFLKTDLKKYFFPGIVVFLVVLPLVFKIIGGQAISRYQTISVFSSQQLINGVIEKRSLINNSFSRLFYNKPIVWTKEIISNYLSAFSPSFLFLKGDPNPRHSVPGFGNLPVIYLPFLLFGLFALLKSSDRKQKIVLVWLLVAPIASALTIGGGEQSTRLFLLTVPLVILTAIGFLKISSLIGGRLLIFLILGLIIFNLVAYGYEVLTFYPKEQYRYWHYGYKEITLALRRTKKCQTVFFNNRHEPFLIRYLFWGEIDPAWFHQNFKGDNRVEVINSFFEGFALGKSYFGALIGEDKLASIRKILEEKSTCYVAFQKDEVPGDWDLSKSPLSEVKVLHVVKTPFNEPYIYLLSRE